MCKSKFDNWSDVKDCNDCEHYWNKLCDGVPEGSERRCTAFKATRSVEIPAEIDALKERLKWLSVSTIWANGHWQSSGGSGDREWLPGSGCLYKVEKGGVAYYPAPSY